MRQLNVLRETIVMKGSSTEKLYQELGIELLRSRRWFRKLCLLYKIIKSKSPLYLFNLIPAVVGCTLLETQITKHLFRLGITSLQKLFSSHQ